MRTALCVLAIASTAIAGDPSASVVTLQYPGGGFCSGVSVAGGYILTAEHCGCADGVTVTFRDGTRLTASTAHDPEKNNRDQVMALRLSGKAPASVVITQKSASKGDRVRSYGYPSGKWSINEGLVIRTSAHFTGTDFFILAGNSGGGLFNSQGELLGIASSRNDLNGEPGSHFVSLAEINLTMTALGVDRKSTSDYTKSSEVVIFTTPGCAPCERLKSDISQGHFKSFNIQMVSYQAGVWSNQVLVNEMYAAIPEDVQLKFPLIWVRGTANYRVGYSPDRRGGLIGFLASVLDGIGKIIVGEAKVPEFPIRPYRRGPDADESPSPKDDTPPPVEDAGAPQSDLAAKFAELRADLEQIKSANPLDKIRGVVALKEDIGELKTAIANNKSGMVDVESLRENLAKVKGSLDTLRNGNPLAKIAALRSLKDEVADLKTVASKAKDDAQEDPWLFLLGLPGIITGLLHRRMAA